MKDIKIDEKILKVISDKVNDWLPRFGVQYGIYNNGIFSEQKHPFDPIPRIIDKETWKIIESGVEQRVKALNMFLYDIYHKKEICEDGIIPEELTLSSNGYMPICQDITPTNNIYAHIAGIDLVEDSEGKWHVMQDNLRIPGSVVYPIIARKMWHKHYDNILKDNHIADNLYYKDMLKKVFDFYNDGNGINVVLTTGRANHAFYEHKFLAESTKATLAYPGDLFVDKGKVYYGGEYNLKQRVSCIYRRVTAEDIDPVILNHLSNVGISNVFESYKNNKVTFINALGNGVGDDKALFYFVPQMIRYYLNEEPILPNVKTYIPYYEEDLKYICENMHKLIIRNVKDRGRFGVFDGRSMSPIRHDMLRKQILSEPRKWVANEYINLNLLKAYDKEGNIINSRSNLRIYALTTDRIEIWKGGLTRFSRQPESNIIENEKSSGFKDTWIETD